MDADQGVALPVVSEQCLQSRHYCDVVGPLSYFWVRRSTKGDWVSLGCHLTRPGVAHTMRTPGGGNAIWGTLLESFKYPD